VSARDDDRAADLRARRAAQSHFGAPMILEAGAGTGKTTVLVARVLAWCLGPGWERTEQRLTAGAPARTAPIQGELFRRSELEASGPFTRLAPERVAETLLERVVAITFTEAAAAEMETRALDACAAIANGAPVIGFDPTAIGVDPERQRERARALLGGFDHLRFQTIHAFCRRLLAAHPLEAGLHPRFGVDASGAVRAAAVRETLEARLREIQDAGDADFEALIVQGVGAADLEAALVALATAAVPADRFAADPLSPAVVGAWVAELRDAASAFADAEGGRFATLGASSLARRCAEAAHETLAILSRSSASTDAFAAQIDALRALWPDNLWKHLAKLAEGELGRNERAVVDATRIAAIASAAGGLHARVKALGALEPRALAVLHRVLAPLLAEVERRLVEAGAESFDALLRRTRDLLATAPQVAAAVRSEIDQLLVDEFQDTDRVQCDIVERLALEGDPAQRPGLFLVGDPKQSVYGWRSADVGAYMRFVERAAAVPGARRGTLCVNHRSVPDVLAEVERVIAPVMREERELQPPFQALAPAAAKASTEGSGTPGVPAVEYWWSDGWNAATGAFTSLSAGAAAELEAAHLVADLRRAEARGVAWKQIALLLRSTGDLDVYLAALRDAEIPYVVDRDRSYYQRREVRDAASLVAAVLDPSDQLALVATLRSAWVGVPDAAWAPLWTREFPDVVRDALAGRDAAVARLTAITAETARAIAERPGLAALAGWDASLVHAVGVIASLRRTFATEPIDAFVEALRTRTLCEASEAARYPGGFRLANLARFFRELEELLEEHGAEIAPVLRKLRSTAEEQAEFYEGRPEDPDEDAVRVMTIHGAKGLDFDHVYLLQAHKGSSASAQPFEHEIRGDALEWRFATPRLRVATLGWGEVEARRAALAHAESVRTLYVALTRTKSRLVVAGRLDGKAKGTHADWIWRSRGAAFQAARERLLVARRASPEASTERADGALVRWIGLEAIEGAGRSSRTQVAIEPARVRREAEQLARADVVARARRERRHLGRASESTRDARHDRMSARLAGEPGPSDRDADVAAAVGTAIHAFLERFAFGAADPAAEWQAREAELRSALSHLDATRRDRATERAVALLAALRESELWRTHAALAPHTIARELPVLLCGEEAGEGAVGATVGAIDWIYWDAAAGEPVVVDFKTDRVANDADLADRVRAHRSQTALYRRAVTEAFGLARPPRVELWFLAAARREVVPVEGG
jgi:ATP-dependent helicase/nuclease subunit A